MENLAESLPIYVRIVEGVKDALAKLIKERRKTLKIDISKLH